MNNRKILAFVFILISIVLGILFYLNVTFPKSVEGYFSQTFYGQFGSVAICVELFIAGYFLFMGRSDANFPLALFGFTALLDPIFNLAGLFTSAVPIYATVIFVVCAVAALWLAFTDTFSLGRISFIESFSSFLLGCLVELFFNGLF